MQKLWYKLKKNVLLFTITSLIIFVISHFSLSLLNIRYRQWVYYLEIVLVIIGIIAGVIQIIRTQNKKVKKVFSIIGVCIMIILVFYWQMIVFIIVLSYSPEHVISKNGNKYLAYVNSFLRVNVDYYDYINFFLVGNKIRISEHYGKGGYDPFDGQHNGRIPEYTTYYDENGRIINNNENTNTQNNDMITYTQSLEKTNTNQEILYKKQFDDNTIIRVVVKDYILAQRLLIGIEKTIDNGKNWVEQIEDSEGVIQIHNGAKFIFIDENIGFINDPGLAGTSGDNRGLLVTIDGGKNFTEAVLISESNSIENLYIDDIPYLEDNILKLKTHITKNSKKEYYYFYSEDKGITWKQL